MSEYYPKDHIWCGCHECGECSCLRCKEEEGKAMSEKRTLIFYPPEGKEFRECVLCHNPFVWDERWNCDNCIWCEIHKEEVKSNE